MKITLQTDYAIRCLLELSRGHDRQLSVPELTGLTDAPAPFLHKILQKLSKAGLVQSIRGKKGGFKLHRVPAEISILSVVEAIGDSLALNECVNPEGGCDRSPQCPLHPWWKVMQANIERSLGALTLATVLKQGPPADFGSLLTGGKTHTPSSEARVI